MGQVLEYITPSEWLTTLDLGAAGDNRLQWAMSRVKAAAKAADVRAGCMLLGAALDVLAYPAHANSHPRILELVILLASQHELLGDAEVHAFLRARLPALKDVVGESGSVKKNPYRDVWIAFFRESWTVCRSLDASRAAADLTATLLMSETKNQLSSHDVRSLAPSRTAPTELAVWKLLVTLAPTLAIGAFGYRILQAEPAYAANLTTSQLSSIVQLSTNGLRDDTHWSICRQAIGHVEPSSALRLAIDLVRHSHELDDLELVAKAYKEVDAFTRKQVCPPPCVTVPWCHTRAIPSPPHCPLAPRGRCGSPPSSRPSAPGRWWTRRPRPSAVVRSRRSRTRLGMRFSGTSRRQPRSTRRSTASSVEVWGVGREGRHRCRAPIWATQATRRSMGRRRLLGDPSRVESSQLDLAACAVSGESGAWRRWVGWCADGVNACCRLSCLEGERRPAAARHRRRRRARPRRALGRRRPSRPPGY